MVSEERKERLMERKVVSGPVAGTWLVNDSTVGFGKSQASGVAVYFYQGRGGWWACEKCGSFVNNTKEPCEHLKAVGTYAAGQGGL